RRHSSVRCFFSSRRRHARSYGDWSSGVCSSDLDFRESLARISCVGLNRSVLLPWKSGFWLSVRLRFTAVYNISCYDTLAEPSLRSEERRVGKGCRARWSPYLEKTKKRITVCIVS